MLRKSLVSLVLGGSLVSIPVAAQEPAAESTPEAPPATAQPTPPPLAAAPSEVKSEADQPGGWHTEIGGYFRAPMALGISSRPNPDTLDQDPNSPTLGKLTGPNHTQVSYGPNRVMDWNYYSFAYTRLQEQDWAEFFIHAKKKHVDAAVGWMGYWFGGVGFRNYDAAWAPGLAYVALDSDFQVAGYNPNIAFTAGAWWPRFGYFEKYDTYTLGRFRQMGGQLKLTVPINPDVTPIITTGFGTNRDGSFNTGAPAFYGSVTSIDLLWYLNAQIKFNNILDASFHYNTMWTADPNKWNQSMVSGKSFTAAQQAHLTVIGAEAHVRLPRIGHIWVSPSFISVRNGWALDNGGTEVMHSLGGAGVAGNYLGFVGNTDVDNGSGSMFNVGFLYENSLSNARGKAPGALPDVMFSVFGLYADANLNLPTPPMGTPTTGIPPHNIKQFKWGADATLQYLTWLGFMLRFDTVNYDLDQPGLVFLAVTPRVIVTSHFLSTERIYLQYSRYKYGDKMTLAGTRPWLQPIVAGSNVLQQGAYQGATPDENVIKLQAEIAF